MLKKFISILSLLFIFSCSVTSPYKVSKEDSQRALATEVGNIIDVVPVTIQGEKSEVGAVAGGLIGGIAAESIGMCNFTFPIVIEVSTSLGFISEYAGESRTSSKVTE